MRETFDIIIVGAGPAGAVAALACAEAGLETALIDRAAPAEAAARDLRTTALLGPSVAHLTRLGVWRDLADAATPLRALRIEDHGAGDAAPQMREFTPEALGAEAFGWNVANAELKRALLARIAETARIRLFAPAELISELRREDAALATIETSAGVRQLSARLLVAADGRDSALRSAAGLEARRIDHGQSAIVCVLRHPAPHDGVSIEIYSAGGPFTLVPFSDDADGSPRSSLVWMGRDPTTAARAAMEDDVFAHAATARCRAVFGALSLTSERRVFKVESLYAPRWRARRLALMGEAAHATPPIGAQGLNMSLADAERLAAECAAAHADGRDLGSQEVLAAYERRRRSDVAARVGSVAALNLAADGALAPIRSARRFGLAAVFDVPPIRDALTRAGFGAAVDARSAQTD